MKQRSKILLALLLSASVATTPIASVSVFAEDLDFVAVEDNTDTSAEDDFDSKETSVIAEDNTEADDFASEEANLFSAGEGDTTADATDQADATEAKTHSIKVTVVNSSGAVSGMYAMDSAVVTKQDDGTYLVRMHQTSVNRNYMALTDDKTKALNHEVDWYVGGGADGYWYTFPVTSLTDTVYASFSKSPTKTWSNIQTITFDVSSMAETSETDAVASDMNIQPSVNTPADYTAVDEALAKVPTDLSIYTDETAAAVTAAVNAVQRDYKIGQQADVDKMAADINTAVEALVEKGLLTVTNRTAMFNVTKAVLRKTETGNKLIVTLHGTGYHYLYKGTYEEAVANGDNRANWIAGELVDGKWQFTIPVADGETFLPIVAISNSYLTKYEEGKNTLERAFYPRQAVIDETAATLTTGDYDHTKNLTVSNSVKMFKVDAATLETIGGPNSNNYKEILHLTMGSDSFDKVFIGSAEDAAKAETTTDITERKADLTVKANAMGGATTTDYLEKEVVFSFHSVKNDSWYERVFTISKAGSTLTIAPHLIPATEVALDTTAKALEPGGTVKLTATITPSNTTDSTVWSSENEDVATVTEDGTVTAVKTGSAVITATAGSVKAECTVTVSNTHAINVTVNNKTTGIYAFKNVVITKQEDGTYLVRMQGADSVRDYIAFADGTAKTDLVPVYNHEVEWHRGKVTTTTDEAGKKVKEVTYTVPVKSLTDPIYVAFSSEQNLNDPWKKPEKRWNGAYLLKFDVDSMTDTTEGEAVASDINAVPATVTKTVLTATNTTGMFNVTDALLTKDTEHGNTLTVTLHGTGYHYLYKGTYEEAVANGDNRDNWIAGELVDGKWQFKIPVADGETFLPIVAISNSYLTKYENGQNSLERAFYPRQAVIDEAAATLTTGDYDHTKDLTVNNSVKMFKVDAAALETVGGPNSNNYKEVLHLTMGSDSFDKVYIGSAEDAAKAETTTAIAGRKADLTVKANAMGGATTTDYLEKEVVFSFHSVKNDSWYERVFNISKANGTLTITPVQVPATAITLNTTSQKLTEGKTVTLAATVTPADTTDAVVWTSSNTKVATVSADGVVTAVKEGTAVITATAGNAKATCKITVSKAVVKVTKVSVTASARNIAAGKKVQLKAAVTPSKATNKAVTWKSSNTKVATVSSKGVVTFSKKAGGKKVTITATAKDGSKKYGKITLTCMKGSVKKITLSGVKTLKAGKTAKVKAKVTTMNGKANKTLTWTSSNTKIATVDKTGKVKAVKGKKGTVTITARATDGSGKKATIKIRVR